ncbi:MAG: hypothetical protein V8S38_11910 [Lachnospiraceae bacterium]
MKARGFGQRRRTTYHLFRFDSRDSRCLGLIAALLAAAILFRAFGFGYVEFYPRIRSLAEGASLAGRNPHLTLFPAGIT